MKKERDLLPDIVRGFAILMVVYGHCIQEGNGYDFSANMSYFDDKIYQFIYSFQKPCGLFGFNISPCFVKGAPTNDRRLLCLHLVY